MKVYETEISLLSGPLVRTISAEKSITKHAQQKRIKIKQIWPPWSRPNPLTRAMAFNNYYFFKKL